MNSESSFWLSPSAVNQPILDTAFSFFAISAAIVAVVLISLLLFAANKKGPEFSVKINHRWKLQIALQGTVAIGIALFFYCGTNQYIQLVVPPNNAKLLSAVADSGHITFNYGIGEQTDTLTVPSGESIQVDLKAIDNAYTLSIPALRVNQTIFPGKTASAWFTPHKKGQYEIELASEGIADVSAHLIIKENRDYEDWLAKTFDPSGGKSPEEYGKMLYESKACKACHTLDGTALIAPSMKGLFGSRRKLKSGKTVLVDENYIKKSILEPAADIADGFNPVMAPYPLSEKELEAMVAYIKTQK